MSYTIHIHDDQHDHHGNRGHCGHYGRRSRGRRRDHRPGHGHGHGHGRGRGGRAGRGDLRNVILLLLADQPMHGYQIITTISEATGENWAPSPGAIYPRLSMLEDEGLITIAVSDGRKLASLTDVGRELVTEHRADWSGILDTYRDEAAGPHHERRAAMRRLRETVKRSDDAHTDRVVAILRRAEEEIAGL